MDDLYPDPLAGRPEGACLLAIPSQNVWWVRGRSTSYTVAADRMECNCLDYTHRHAVARTTCRHLRALERYLTLLPCPCCKQMGCVACEGMGRVPKEEHEALLEVSLAPLPDDDSLREIFR